MKGLFHLAKNVFLSNFKRLKFPYKLTLILTYKCNSRCKLCNIWKKKIKEELTLDEITRFFKRSNKFYWINLGGGEIFLRRDLVKIIEVITKYCKRLYLLHFATNGLLTNFILKQTKKIKELLKSKLIISVSLDGPTKLHDKLRGVNGSWKKAVLTFKKLRGAGIETYFGMTLSNYNVDKFDEMFSEIKKEIPLITYNDFHVNIAHSSDHYYGNKKFRLNEEKIIKFIDRFIKLRKFPISNVSFLEKKYLKNIKNYFTNGKSPIKCTALNSSCFIDPYGDLYPCSIYNKKLGNIKKFNFNLNAMWNLRWINKLQKEIYKGKCPGCWTPCEAYPSILGNLVRRRL